MQKNSDKQLPVKREECELTNRANCRSESGEQVVVYFDAGLSLLEERHVIGQEPNLFTNQRLIRHFLRTAFPLDPLSVLTGELSNG